MITKQQAMLLTYRDEVYSVFHKRADGQPMRARVNGKCQTWKTRPNEFRLPMKHGLYDCFAITEKNADAWYVPELTLNGVGTPVPTCPADALQIAQPK